MEKQGDHQRTLYVLLDFSDYASAELRLAKSWAESKGLEVKVLHQPDFFAPSMATKQQRLRLEYEQIREINHRWLRLKDEIFGPETSPGFEIVKTSLDKYLESEMTKMPGIIIMGLKGGGKLKQIFLGSMVTELVEKLNAYITAVPKTLTVFEPKELVVSVSPHYTFNYEGFATFLPLLPSSIKITHWISVVENPEDEKVLLQHLKLLSEKIKSHMENKFTVFCGEEVFEKVKTFISSEKGQFLVVQKGGRTFKDKLFRRFLINDLVYDGSVPLVIIPA